MNQGSVTTVRTTLKTDFWQALFKVLKELMGEGCAGPHITGIPFVNLQNSCLLNQLNETHLH